jgi:cobalamin biosynthesis Mg chelatase CobN
MPRFVLLVLSVALAVLVFAPVTVAQSDDMGMDDTGMGAGKADDMGVDDRGMDDNMMASPTSSASATASARATTSASASAMMSTSASASASPSSSASSMMSASPTPSASTTALPDTGGAPLVPLMAAAVLILLAGTGIVAIPMMRRTS